MTIGTAAILPITPAQLRTARDALGWSRDRLAAESDVGLGYLMTYERYGRIVRPYSRDPSFDGLNALRATLETAGVEFTDGDEPGEKLRKADQHE